MFWCCGNCDILFAATVCLLCELVEALLACASGVYLWWLLVVFTWGVSFGVCWWWLLGVFAFDCGLLLTVQLAAGCLLFVVCGLWSVVCGLRVAN